MKKIMVAMVLAVAVFCGCHIDPAGAEAGMKPDDWLSFGESRRIIIDTDAGGDDALAILMAAHSPNITIEGVTVLQGNVTIEQATKNALMTLETAGYECGVYPGATQALDGVERETFSVYGTDGMGDMDLVHPTGSPSEKSAVDFILETVRKYPDEIEIVALGPVTNIANAIMKAPETMTRVKRIWSMGSAGLGHGNATPAAEFNVYKDVDAYKVMLDSGVHITVIGLDVCDQEEAAIESHRLAEMEKKNPVLQYASRAFSKLLEFRAGTQGVDNVIICDAIAMGCVIWSDFVVDAVDCGASCITHDCEARGMVLFYRSDMTYDTMPKIENMNVRLVRRIRLDRLYENIVELLSGRD